ncbi:MAG: proton-conducting transporter membrane subunit [Pseudomonadota bacterium]
MIALPAGWVVADAALALPLAPLIALAAVPLVLALRARPNLREAVTLSAGVLLAALVLGLWPHADAGLRYPLWSWLPGLSLELALEPLGLLFASVAALLWPVTSLYAIGYMRANEEAQQTRFYVCFAIAIASAMLIALAGNGVTLFIGYEALTLSTWPLVTHKGNEDARRGGRTYLVVLLTTSIGLLLPALIWTYALAGTTEFRDGGILAGRASHGVLAVLFALYLFGVGKAALMPFHRWLPSAMVAPTPVSALLHAVAVVKAGVFTVLKVAVYIFGIDTLHYAGATVPMLWVAAFTLLAASLVAMLQDNLKARLAYSTVSQLAYIVLAACMATTAGALGGAAHIATHAVGKITLFFCAGAIYTAAHKTRVSELDGLGRQMPFTFAAFAIGALSVIGLPPLAGLWSKWWLMQGAVDAGWPWLMAVLMLSSLLNIAYLLPIPVRAFFRPAVATHAEPGVREAPLACVLPLCLTAAACLLLFFGIDTVVAPLTRLFGLP